MSNMNSKPIIQTLTGWHPSPVEISVDDVPPKFVKKIEDKLKNI